MRFLKNVSRITGDEWEFCNGYAIGKYVHVNAASAVTAQLACEYDGL
jgi:hypothetical protein